MGRSARALTPKETRFKDFYLVNLNATKSAVLAGYSNKTARQQGSRLLSKAAIQAAIAEGEAALAERNEVTQDWLVEKTKEILQHALTPVRTKDRYGKPTGPEMRQLGAANTAVFNLAKLCGLWIDKKAEMPANLAQELFEAIGAKPMKLIEHDPDDGGGSGGLVASELLEAGDSSQATDNKENSAGNTLTANQESRPQDAAVPATE